MSKNNLRYRIGIDVGLYSVGLAAIEIDDSSCDPRSAMPIKFLSLMSVVHDGAIDPDKEKSANSRKEISGIARRTRRLHKRCRERYRKLDAKLIELGYPVCRAVEIVSGQAQYDQYLPWHVRKQAVEEYIPDETQRKLAIAIALRHVIRHRGWRNPYSSVESLKDLSETESAFYLSFVKRINAWRTEQGLSEIDLGAGDARPTVAQLIDPLLEPLRKNAFRRHGTDDAKEETHAFIDKLHQSDYFYEICRIFDMQKVPQEDRWSLLRIVFDQISPKDTGHAAERVGKDDLQPNRRRALKASVAFQRYRILTTVSNLRIKVAGSERPLTVKEKQAVCDYLCSEEAARSKDELTWHDVAEKLGVERNCLKGVGGQTPDGDPISAKYPPVVSTAAVMLNLHNDLSLLSEWWKAAESLEKEFLVEMMGNAGISQKNLSEREQSAFSAAQGILADLGNLNEEALAKLDDIHLASGRASYSVDTLRRLNKRMYEEGMDLHEARKAEFGVADTWRPSPNPLGTQTGNPAVDRTIKIVSRWLKACERQWGIPETVNIEHVREGFMSEKAKREYEMDNNRRHMANVKARQQLAGEMRERGLGIAYDIDSMRTADIRRLQAIQRQNGQCLYCGTKIDYLTAQMDHIVPRRGAGSSNDLPNLVAVCEQCNMAKSNTPFARWAGKDVMEQTVNRVHGMIRDSYFSSDKLFLGYKKDVIARLRQADEDPELDVRSIESVAWMARELREQIEGFFGARFVIKDSFTGETRDIERVKVYRGQITAEARKASGIECKLPWYGGAIAKTRLDRRHHAVDAAIIAMLRQGVAKTLAERSALRRDEQMLGVATVRENWGAWKKYQGMDKGDTELYAHWKDCQMVRLCDMLQLAMTEDKIPVTRPLRLRLGLGKAHKDTIEKVTYRRVGDSYSAVAIDKAATPALWKALVSCPGYDFKDGLPADPGRVIQVHGKILTATAKIPFLSNPRDNIDKVVSAVYIPVRGGMVGAGDSVHHARFYRIPKVNSKGRVTGYKYAMLRVFQVDLAACFGKDLFHVELPAQSTSVRNAVDDLRLAFDRGEAEYLGWAVAGQEIIIRPGSSKQFDPQGTRKMNLFLRAFPECARYEILGFGTNARFQVRPAGFAAEGLDGLVMQDAELEDAVRKVVKDGCPLAVDGILSSNPVFIHRNALGMPRWKSANNMPICWGPGSHPQV